MDQTESLRCLPVSAIGNRYIPSGQESSFDLPEYDAMEHYLKEHHSHFVGHVEIDGITYETVIFEPRGAEDQCYALVRSDGLPDDGLVLGDAFTKELQDYLYTLRDKIAHGEALSPSEATYLPTEFIPPTFQSVNGETGLPSNMLLSWAELSERSRVIIQAPPGMGKTTCLRMLALNECRKVPSDKSSRLPVYIQLRELSASNQLVLRFHAGLIAAVPGQNESSIQGLVDSGRTLLLLDGLDEVRDDLRAELTKVIHILADEHPNLGLIMSTRPSGLGIHLPEFLYVAIQPFNRLQIEEWIRRRLSRQSDELARQVILRLFEDSSIADLAGSPLLLSMVAGIAERTGTVPAKQSALILRYIDALIDEWDQARGVRRHSLIVSRETLLGTLCRTAFRTYLAGKSSFTEQEFVDWESEWSTGERSPEVLKYLWRSTSLCMPDNKLEKEWVFSHKSFVEVLAAKYLIERTDDPMKAYPVKVDVEGFDQVWRLACEMAQDASSLVDNLGDYQIADSRRAVLLSYIIAKDVTLRRQVVSSSCDLIARVVSRYARDTKLTRDEISDDHWALELQWKDIRSPNRAPRMRDFALLLRALTGGPQSETRLFVAKRLSGQPNRLSKAIALRMERTGVIRQVFNEDERIILTEAIAPESSP